MFDIIDSTVRLYLAEGRDEPVADFTVTTPFMDAGLDSLDMLKVSPASVMCFLGLPGTSAACGVDALVPICIPRWCTCGQRLSARHLARPAASQALTEHVLAQVMQLLGNALGMVLPATIVFDYPTIESLAERVAGQQAQPPPAASTRAPRRSSFSALLANRRGSLSDVFQRRCRPQPYNTHGTKTVHIRPFRELLRTSWSAPALGFLYASAKAFSTLSCCPHTHRGSESLHGTQALHHAGIHGAAQSRGQAERPVQAGFPAGWEALLPAGLLDGPAASRHPDLRCGAAPS